MLTTQTSKLWNSQHHPDDVEKALDECLAELELDYLDVRTFCPCDCRINTNS